MLQPFDKDIFRRLCKSLGLPIRRRDSKPRIIVQKLRKSNSRTHRGVAGAVAVNGDASSSSSPSSSASAAIYPSNEVASNGGQKPIRVATFNAALFSMAPIKPARTSLSSKSLRFDLQEEINQQSPKPKGILKQSSPLHPSSTQQRLAKSSLRVSINLPDNEISLKKSGHLSFEVDGFNKGKSQVRSHSMRLSGGNLSDFMSSRTVLEVLREVNADILALQDVKAEEEKGMSPLSELATALGMNYVFAETWAPEYGNAILSKWSIKRWKAQKIFDDSDFRNVLKATIDVPKVGEINVFSTLLDHLDEKWRMKQINAIIQSTGVPHILAGGLNSLDETDYSQERWSEIVKYYEEMGKVTPRMEVMKHLRSKRYTDAKDFAGECESVVMIAKGQSVQGTCKYGTRVDYILSSAAAPYKFVPGSYSVVSSKGTSDHHIVKVDLIVCSEEDGDGGGEAATVEKARRWRRRQNRGNLVKFTHSSSPYKGIWKLHS